MSDFTLTLSCAQRPGIVHAITRFMFQHDADILAHQQFDDAAREASCSCEPPFVSSADTPKNG